MGGALLVLEGAAVTVRPVRVESAGAAAEMRDVVRVAVAADRVARAGVAGTAAGTVGTVLSAVALTGPRCPASQTTA